MKTKILYVTQSMVGAKAACGIGLMGKLLGETLLQHPEYDFVMLYADSVQEVVSKIQEVNPKIVIYNYSLGSTPWMHDPIMRTQFSHIKHARILHDMHQGIVNSFHPRYHQGWEYLIADDPSVVGNDNVFITNRLLPPPPTVKYVEPSKPIIGFQGFGPAHKGIARLAHIVQSQFDEATLRLHIPLGYYVDFGATNHAYARVKEVNQIITKPGIDVVITHDLLDTQDVVNLLAQNTINCYFYDYLDGAGLASSPDYAIARGRPIAVTRSHQMRHFWNLTPSILIENASIQQIINQGTAPLEPLYKAYSKESVWQDYTRILQKMLG